MKSFLKDVDPKLHKFLLKEKALEKYLLNAMDDNCNGAINSRTIIDAFVWCDTPEKSEYWESLYIKWEVENE